MEIHLFSLLRNLLLSSFHDHFLSNEQFHFFPLQSRSPPCDQLKRGHPPVPFPVARLAKEGGGGTAQIASDVKKR